MMLLVSARIPRGRGMVDNEGDECNSIFAVKAAVTNGGT